MPSQKGYSNFVLPDDLCDEIDKIVAEGGLGFKSRSEAIKTAVRGFIIWHRSVWLREREALEDALRNEKPTGPLDYSQSLNTHKDDPKSKA